MATSSATAGAANLERTVDIFARREERLRKAFGRTSKPGAARELKAKNIAALLECVSISDLGLNSISIPVREIYFADEQGFPGDVCG